MSVRDAAAMAAYARIIVLLTALAIVPAGAPEALLEARDRHRTEPVVLTPECEALINEVVGMYEAAGLQLRNVEIGIYDDPAECGEGRQGFHRVREDGISVVAVCADHDVPRLRVRTRRHVLIHELGHAWAEQHLSGPDKERFLAVRGLEVWSAAGTEWGECGAEHAAEIIAWNISVDAYLPHPELSDRRCSGFREGYEVLTGKPSPPNRIPTCTP
jgi:hypothetical protein